MSIQEIKNKLKEVKENREDFSWVDEEIVELLLAVAEHLVNDSKRCSTPEPAKEFVTLKAFEQKYKFVSAHTLYKYCLNDQAFADEFSVKSGCHWYVNEDKTLAYLKTLSQYKKRLDRLGMT